MRNTSSAYKKQIKGIREFCAKIIINYADGSTQTLTDLQDFKQLKFVEECSGSSEFEALITLNNRTGKFDGKNFYGAHISAYVGILVDGKPELLEMGHYIVDEPVSPGISIALTAYDNMILLEKAYVPGITYPATLGNITKDICAQCGVILESSDFPRNSYVVESAPENATCREVLAAAAQLAGCFAKARANGRIAIAWYAAASSLTVDTLRNKSICTDDVTITGITVSKGESAAQAGADGYRLSIIDNILLEESKIQEMANYLASKLVAILPPTVGIVPIRPIHRGGRPHHDQGWRCNVCNSSNIDYFCSFGSTEGGLQCSVANSECRQEAFRNIKSNYC